MSHTQLQTKRRIMLPLPYTAFGVELGALLTTSQTLTQEEVVVAVNATNQYPQRWHRFSPLFICCANLPNAWMVKWVHPHDHPTHKVFDRMVCCLVWRDGTATIRVNATCYLVIRNHAEAGWDGLTAEPSELVLSRPAFRRLVA